MPVSAGRPLVRRRPEPGLAGSPQRAPGVVSVDAQKLQSDWVAGFHSGTGRRGRLISLLEILHSYGMHGAAGSVTRFRGQSSDTLWPTRCQQSAVGGCRLAGAGATCFNCHRRLSAASGIPQGQLEQRPPGIWTQQQQQQPGQQLTSIRALRAPLGNRHGELQPAA
jgi:hypothetical protein